MVSEEKIIKAFNRVKGDIINLQDNFLALKKSQEDILYLVEKIGSKKVAKRKTFIGSKRGKKFHVTSCPFAKNIKTKVRFNSKNAALRVGYKACKCV